MTPSFLADGGTQNRNQPLRPKQFVRDWLARSRDSGAGAGAAPACRHHRQDRREVPRSAAAAHELIFPLRGVLRGAAAEASTQR